MWQADYWQNSRIKTVMSGEWSSILEVTSAQREDGGEYYCEVVFEKTAAKSRRYTLQITECMYSDTLTEFLF